MPYEIKKAKGGGYDLVRKADGSVKSHHSTMGKAQMSAYFSEHGEAPPGSNAAKKGKK